jgi:hypothetical protein
MDRPTTITRTPPGDRHRQRRKALAKLRDDPAVQSADLETRRWLLELLADGDGAREEPGERK